MATKKGGKVFGQRLVAALVPSRFDNLTALQMATGYAYSTIHDWSTGKSDPRLEIVQEIAAKVGVDPADLLRGEPLSTGPKGQVRNHPAFQERVIEAKHHRPGRLPDYA